MLYNYSCSCFNLTLSQLCEIPKQGKLEVGPKTDTLTSLGNIQYIE